MSNWRITVKEWFKEAITSLPEFENGFDIWNNQVSNQQNEDIVTRVKCYFEYSNIGDNEQFSRQRNIQSASVIPVDITLHIVHRNFKRTEAAQDDLYNLVDKVIRTVLNKSVATNSFKRVEKTGEGEDTNHDSLMDYQVTFSLNVAEIIEATGTDVREQISPYAVKVQPTLVVE